MTDILPILFGLKVAIFLSVLAIAVMEVLMNKKKTALFGLILMAVSFLTMGLVGLLAFDFVDSLMLDVFNKIFLLLGGIGLIIYFYGLRRIPKN